MAAKKHKKTPLLFVATGLFFVITVIFSVEAVYSRKIFPGIHVGDVQLGNLSEEEATMVLQQRFSRVKDVHLVWGVNTWTVSADQIQLLYLPDQIVSTALGMTHWAQRLESLRRGIEIEPSYQVSESRVEEFITGIANEVDIPATEPQISLDTTTNSVIVSPGANGRQVDNRQLWQNLRSAFSRMDTSLIALPVVELKPQLSADQVTTAQKRANQLLGKSLQINGVEDGQTWTIGTTELFGWIDPTSPLGWKRQAIADWASELAKTVDRLPENANFHITDTGRVTEFKPAKDGLVVSQDILVTHLIDSLTSLQAGDTVSPITLPLASTPPAVGNGDANSLGIDHMLAKGESWFTGSITNRIFNIQKAASVLNGVLVAPGETFSFNTVVGEISQATGYKSAFVIKDGKTILGDGGGVCQVSSTLFRAVLAAGLPIPLRTAHAYRVSYYEQNYQPGFDATIFQPSPDFTFVNDTPAHILIQTLFDEKAKKLTFSLYGTSDGRKAEVSKARVWDVVPAPPDLYIDDPTLPIGQVKQTEHKANGAKVAFDWKVTRGDEVLQEKTFYSNYKAWQAVYLRGTKPN